MSDFPPPPPQNRPMRGSVQAVDVAPAPLGRRFGALSIDLVIGSVSGVGFFILFANSVIGFFNRLGTAVDPYNYQTESTIDVGVFLGIFVSIGVVWAISSLILMGLGTSPGKRILGLYVVDSNTGTVCGFRRMFAREALAKGALGTFFSGIPLIVGIIMILASSKRQAYWDRMVGTVVVYQV